MIFRAELFISQMVYDSCMELSMFHVMLGDDRIKVDMNNTEMFSPRYGLISCFNNLIHEWTEHVTFGDLLPSDRKKAGSIQRNLGRNMG